MNRLVYAIVTHSTKYLRFRHLTQAPTPSLHSLRRCYSFVVGEKPGYIARGRTAAAPGSHAPLSQRKKQLRSFLNVAGSTKATFPRLLGKLCRLPTYCKSLLREAVCVATAAAARACRLSALLRSSPGSAYSCASTEPVLVHEKQFSACVCSTGGRPASRSSRFVYMVLCGREAAREAETGRVLFVSVSVVMNGHVFAENGSRGAVQ